MKTLRLLIRHMTKLKKYIFKTLLQRISNYEVGIFDKYTTQKKNTKKQFLNPLAQGYQMPFEMQFSKKSAAPTVQRMLKG